MSTININDHNIQQIFIDSIELISEIIYNITDSKGFHRQDRKFAEEIALMHSELSEALEADRINNPESKKIPGFSQVEEELADVIIRILDSAKSRDYNIGEAIIAKLQYNSMREYKHGKEY